MRFLFLLFICLTFSFSSYAAQKAEKQKQLTQLKSKIEKLRKTIEVKENSKSSYIKQLRKIEKKIGALSNQIRSSNLAVKSKQKSLNKLEKNKRQIQQNISLQNNQLSEQLHTAYTLGQQEQLKLLFSQKTATNLQRNLTYYEYFSTYRLKQIELSKLGFDKLLKNEEQIISAKTALEKDLKLQREQKKKLSTDRSKREKVVNNLDNQLKKQGKHLSRLEDDAKNLKNLIDSLSDILVNAPVPENSTKRFASLKGKLSWPVKGKVKKLFGHKKPPSNLLWQGVVIHANRGNNVRAVSRGRVAFSDWLRGMGNLVIIDHGDGYLSLYGHNESLYKSTGEWVEAGEIIGSIGSSGGQSKDGLYFEIRRKGKPQNPSKWCKSRNWFTSV